MSLRQRKKTLSKTVEDLDAFPKVPESYVEKEASNAIGKISSVRVLIFIFLCFNLKFG